jgi:two-component system sensor histidine kinase KdpD
VLARAEWAGIGAAVAGTAVLVAVLAPLQGSVGLLNVGLLFLLLTLVISSYWGLRVGLAGAVITNFAFNFFFVEPVHELAVSEASNVLGLAIFLVVSVVGGALLSSARASAAAASLREMETLALLQLSRAMIGRRSPEDALRAICGEVVETFAAPGVSVLASVDGAWIVRVSAGTAAAARELNGEERMLAEKAVVSGGIVRAGETGFGRTRVRIVQPKRWRTPDARGPRGLMFVPLDVPGGRRGVLRIDGPATHTAFSRNPDRMLEAFAAEAALALERVDLASAASEADALRKRDQLKSALMTSISHDLKTPLAGIKTAVTSLLDRNVAWSTADRVAFLETIDSQTDRLDRTISDILDLNRIESGAVRPLRRPILVADLIDEARQRAAPAIDGRAVTTEAEDGLLVVSDESLVRHALVNLLENAGKYSTPGREIRVIGRATGGGVEISVEDEGPGIAAADLPHVFEWFYRAAGSAGSVRGSGLGLAIVRSFVGACGGVVRAESSASGTRFIVMLPVAS